MGMDPDEARRKRAVERIRRGNRRTGGSPGDSPSRADPASPPRPNVSSILAEGEAVQRRRRRWLRTASGGLDAPAWTTVLIVLALVLWGVAQALPAFAIVPDDFICSATPRWDPPETCDVVGILPTLFGWTAAFADLGSFLGWTTNLFVLIALVMRAAGRPVAATTCAITAVVTALWAVGVLTGVVGDAVDGLGIRSIGIGTIPWVASSVVLLAGIGGWAYGRQVGFGSGDREAARSFLVLVAGALVALVVVGGLTLGLIIPTGEWTSTPIPTPTPIPGTVWVRVERQPAVIDFRGGTYRVEACTGDQVIVDGDPRGTPPLELELTPGDHEVDGELRRCDIVFIPVD